jgi:large subunit ribosomal protein L34e
MKTAYFLFDRIIDGSFFALDRYNTRSNKVRIVKTPGGELRYLHLKKKGTAPKCGDCGIKLPGVSAP